MPGDEAADAEPSCALGGGAMMLLARDDVVARSVCVEAAPPPLRFSDELAMALSIKDAILRALAASRVEHQQDE